MALETSTYIVGLNLNNPDGSDQRSTADDHIRLLKAVLKRTFPLMDGAASLSHTQLMFLGDLSASVQFQLNTLRDGSATANNAVNSRFANSASFAATAAALNGVPYTDFARLSQENVFTGQNRFSRASNSMFATERTDGPADAKRWRWQVLSNGSFGLVTETDSGTAVNSAISIGRTGTTVTSINIAATSVAVNGSSALTSASTLNASNLGTGIVPDARIALSAVQQHQSSLSVASAATATNATNAATASNSDTVDGYHASEAATGSTAAARDSSGNLRWVHGNQSSPNDENPTISQVLVTNGTDGFIRKASISHLSQNVEGRNITGRTGTVKTLSNTTPSGGSNGDIWYRY